MEKYSNLKINPDLKKRLDILRKGKTFNQILEEILTYFEMTGVNPKSDRTPPVETFVKELNQQGEAIMNRLTSVIKIIRNIETNKIDLILDEVVGGEVKPKEEVISENEIMDVIKINESLKQKLVNKELEIERIKGEHLNAGGKSVAIIQIVEQYLKSPELTKDNRGNVIVSEIYIKNLINKISHV